MASLSTFKSNIVTAANTAAGVETSAGVTVYASASSLPVSGNEAGDQAFVTGTGRLFIFSGVGWYNVALINNTPVIQSILDSDSGTTPFTLATDGTTTTTITITAVDSDGESITYNATADSDFGGLATISQDSSVFTITPLSEDSATTTSGTIVFTATDGINTATSATQTFRLTFGAADNWEYATFSLGTNDTTNLQNDTFIDRSTNELSIVSGTQSPQQTAFHPYLDNWSAEFDGSSSQHVQLRSYSSTPLYSSNDDLTIECWVYSRTSSVLGLFDGTPSQAGGIRNYPANAVAVVGGTSCTFTLPTYEWAHFAAVFDSTSITVYVNGTSSSSTVSHSGYASKVNFDIGTINGGGDGKFDGYISDFRITTEKLYTSDFTPPTGKLTQLTNTTFLGLQNNRFMAADDVYGGTIAPQNGVSISAYNPFGQGSEYASGENKGSAHFVENQDNFTFNGTSIAIGTGDFTLEHWLYPDTFSADATTLDWRGTNNFGIFNLVSSSGMISFYNGSGGLLTSGIDPIRAGQWNHLVACRSSGILKLFINGQEGYSGSQGASWTLSSSSLTGYNAGNVNYLKGYLADIKLTKTAEYTAAFTPPTSPLGTTNAEVYIPCDNPGIYDKTGNNEVVLYADEATSTSQTKFANSTVYADGTGDYLRIDGLLPFRTGDFTAECWLYTLKSTNYMIFDFRTGNNSAGPTCSVPSGSTVLNVSGNNMGSRPTTNTWHHIAMTRENGVVRLFVDGTQNGNNLNLTNDYTSDRFQTVSAYNYTSMHQNAYIEGLQILQGVAKYTANFTPPSQEQGFGYQAES